MNWSLIAEYATDIADGYEVRVPHLSIAREVVAYAAKHLGATAAYREAGEDRGHMAYAVAAA